jgi:hypothetical protein
MKSPAAILTLAVLTWFGLTVKLRGQSQNTRQRFDGAITLRNVDEIYVSSQMPMQCAAATVVVLHGDAACWISH